MERQKRKKKSTSSGLGPLPAPTASDKKYNVSFYLFQLFRVSITLIKTKTNIGNCALQKSDVIPSIPKPKSSVSPKLGRSTPTNQADTSRSSNGSADLLGLDTTKPETKSSNNDDIFSSFFSAPQEKPVEAPKPEQPKNDLKTEEENFFKQAAPTEKEKSKLTKDSILALYSQTPSTNLANQFNQGQQQQYPFGTVYQPTTSQQPIYSNIGMQNGMQSHFNQFQPMSNQFQQQPFGTPMQQPMQGAQAFQANQFFTQQPPQPNLTQQFGGLNLGQSFPNAFAQPNTNVAGNTTWQ